MPQPAFSVDRPAVPRRGFRATLVSLTTVAVAALLVAACGSVAPTPSPSPSPTPVPTSTPSPSPTPIPTPEPSPETIELIKAVKGGQVAVKGTGRGLRLLDITLTSKSAAPLVVVINQGTVFDPASERTQSMVVLARRMVDLEPGASVPVQLDVACADMQKDTPDKNDRFRLRTGSVPRDLVRLTRLAEFGEQPFRTQQFAVWTITDNPARSGYVGLGTAGGASSGPKLAELKVIADLFRAAEIDPDEYRAVKGL